MKKIINFKNLIIIIFAILIVVEGVVLINRTNMNGKYETYKGKPLKTIKYSLAYDMSTIEKRIGVVDYVFIGEVKKIKETRYDDDDVPTTIYNVVVKENMKGNLELNTTIELEQTGGISKDKKSYIFPEKTEYLETNQMYLFLAFVPFDAGELLINNKYSTVKLDKDNEIQIIKEYKEKLDKQDVPIEKKDNYKSKYDIDSVK